VLSGPYRTVRSPNPSWTARERADTVEPIAHSGMKDRRGRKPAEMYRSGLRNSHFPRPDVPIDSLIDSLPGALCGTSGHSVALTRQTTEYVRHALTCPGTS
jgi:hypothetical protein